MMLVEKVSCTPINRMHCIVERREAASQRAVQSDPESTHILRRQLLTKHFAAALTQCQWRSCSRSAEYLSTCFKKNILCFNSFRDLPYQKKITHTDDLKLPFLATYHLNLIRM